ncbi:hypothetical protein IHN63_00285 [Deinococcus sp. 6YEL10]|uniref:hypothetical protein n=1 Tax=Deinococcus sp. 6YEL10 TaxID=2745870 RepID=UPI001E2E22B2|nr:hypothetical protein [Deinococcus sp. 6YEL10]MCD0159736.1 hypothetical protein [Deinococcus sp. 6YEL10]
MRMALLVIDDPCLTTLDFRLGEATGSVVLHQMRAEVFEAPIPELFLHELREHVSVFPVWLEIFQQEGVQPWRYFAQLIN